MNSRDFLKAGHWPTLLAALLYFDMSFMVWILLGPLGVQIAADLKLDPAAKGFMVALPVLAGALLRVVNGALVDRIGPKRAGLIGQVVVIVGLIAFWASGARSYAAVLSLGLVLGVAGASFAVALPLASRWYPPKYQGLALGLAGAGNSGTVLAALFAPALAAAFGWTNVVGLAAIPLTIALAVYVLLAKDGPNPAPSRRFADYARVLSERRRMAVHVLLRGDVRRLLRPRLVAGDLFQHAVSASMRSALAIARRPACSPGRWSGRSAARSPTGSAAYAC